MLYPQARKGPAINTHSLTVDFPEGDGSTSALYWIKGSISKSRERTGMTSFVTSGLTVVLCPSPWVPVDTPHDGVGLTGSLNPFTWNHSDSSLVYPSLSLFCWRGGAPSFAFFTPTLTGTQGEGRNFRQVSLTTNTRARAHRTGHDYLLCVLVHVPLI